MMMPDVILMVGTNFAMKYSYVSVFVGY